LYFFAAGNGDFARKARKFVPQQYSVFAVSINNNQASGSLLSEGLRFMEMPWFFTLPNEHTIFDAPQTRTLPIIRQRFFALGIDACLAVLNSPLWDENWLMNGISGNWQLKNGTFSRAGKLAFYRGGRLRELTP
jgi:outer membrane PBP1 activator LpoA protein